MKFKPAFVEENSELIDPHTFNDIIIGKYRVLYGYRLRAGIIGEFSYDLDICCGSEKELYDSLFEKITRIIEYNGQEDPFKNIPQYSRIKPYFNDPEFMDKINELHSEALKTKES